MAKEANVSTTAVSYYTNGNGYVSEEKRQRIKVAIQKLGYKPNPVAKNLKMKNSKQLAFLFTEFSNPYHSQLADTAMVTAKNNGYTTLVANYVDDEYVLDLCSYMISGVLVCTYDVSEEALKKIADEMKIPVVILGSSPTNFESPLVSRITFNYQIATEEILAHMKKYHKKKLAYIAYEEDNSTEEYTDAKLEVLENIAKTNKIPLSLQKVFVNIQDIESVTHLMQELFTKKNKKPELLLCLNNSIALVVLNSLAELGISPPEDVEVIAYDDTTYSRICVPKLTVVDLEASYISQLATEVLIKKCQNEKVYDVQISPKLIFRDSTLPE
ncbi:MAG: LacI family DNA-binding transcriptional regulator [Eubacteriales bacterium]